MKNLKKISRVGLKTLHGGLVFVTCTLPNGQPTRCRDRYSQDFCGPTSYMCLIPIDLCGDGI
ncbi:bacteriocin-like protein [Chryseobacterium contaminans]|uniref:bacteriocin-like protein n=1 Tax=Chryseobacterium contaminans TaxID=1423959 RepID=UPI00301A7AC9